MADATFTFRVDDELKNRFAAAAKAHDRNGAQLLRDFMRDYVKREQDESEHDAWFRSEVEAAVREADDLDVARIPHEKFQTSWRRQREQLAKRASGSER